MHSYNDFVKTKEGCTMEKIKNTKKAKIGIYTMGLLCYWAQFDGLRERLLSYGKFIASKVEAMGASFIIMVWLTVRRKAIKPVNILSPTMWI